MLQGIEDMRNEAQEADVQVSTVTQINRGSSFALKPTLDFFLGRQRSSSSSNLNQKSIV